MYMPDLQNQNLIAQLGWTSQEEKKNQPAALETN
jgi:hypothetical protein